MPISTNHRLFQPSISLPKGRGSKKVKESVMKSIEKKISEAVDYTSHFSIYSPEDTISELTTSQWIVLSLFYCLLYGDLALFNIITQIDVPQLKSKFLRVWLVEDFVFRQHDVARVVSMLSFLYESKQVLVPKYMLKIFEVFVERYKVANCCTEGLLAAFNKEEIIEKYIHTLEMEKNTPSQSRKNSITSEGAVSIGSTSSFLRKGSSRWKWLPGRKNHSKSKEVENEELIVVDDLMTIKTTNEKVNYADSTCKVNENDFQSTSEVLNQLVNRHKIPELTESSLLIVVDNEGRSLLHRLAMFGLTDACHRLLDKGIDPNVKDHSGKTALHCATMYNHWETVELLLKRGANVNAKTNLGKTPLSLAYNWSEAGSKTREIILKYEGTL